MLDKRKNREKFVIGNSCMLLAAIFWGVNIVATKALIPAWMTPEGISAVRLIGGAILFWLTSLFMKTEKIQPEDWKKIIFGGVVGLFLFIYLFIISLKYGSAIDISIIMTLPPMFVILLGVVFEHRRPSMLEYTGVVISFIGAVIVILAGSHNTAYAPNQILGDFLAILSCLCFAIYLVVLEKPSHTYAPVSLLRWVFLFSAIPALALVPGMEEMPILHSARLEPWLEIIFILVCPTYLAYFLVQPGMKMIGAELVSLYQYLIPVVAAICAVWMGMEAIEWIQVIAMAVIVIGMILTNIGKKRRIAKKAAPATIA